MKVIDWIWLASFLASLVALILSFVMRFNLRYRPRYHNGPLTRHAALLLHRPARTVRHRALDVLFVLLAADWFIRALDWPIVVLNLLLFVIPILDDWFNGNDRPPRQRRAGNRVRWALYRPGRPNQIGAPA